MFKNMEIVKKKKKERNLKNQKGKFIELLDIAEEWV